MSQILIISDTHYLRKNDLVSFLEKFQDIVAVIHCGDIYLGYEPHEFDSLIPFYICRGNNDFANIPRIENFEIDGIRFTITHGHIHNFAYNPLSLQALLEDYPADVICFGHTHIPYLHEEDDLIIMNPGSLSLSRTYPRQNTYALFDTLTKNISFYDVKTQEKITIEND